MTSARPIVVLAFYKGRTRFLDRLIQWWTASQFSHVELFEIEAGCLPQPLNDHVHCRPDPRSWACWSSSWMDGGGRKKLIRLDPSRWSLVALPWADGDAAIGAFIDVYGAAYDWPGLIRTQVFKLRAGKGWKRHWFCSEIVAHALGLADPWQFSPGGLFYRVVAMSHAHSLQPIPKPASEAGVTVRARQ